MIKHWLNGVCALSWSKLSNMRMSGKAAGTREGSDSPGSGCHHQCSMGPLGSHRQQTSVEAVGRP